MKLQLEHKPDEQYESGLRSGAKKINLNIEIITIDKDVGPYILELNKEYYEKGLYPDYLQHHETPFENIGGTQL